MRTTVLSALAAMTLVACNRIENTIHQWRGEPPARKPGLWRLTVTRSYLAGSGWALFCYDRETDRREPLFIWNRAACERWSMVRRADGSYQGESRCRGARSGMVLAGDFASRFTVDTWVVLDRDAPPLLRAGDVARKHAEWVYQGACPHNIPPGQVQGSDGEVSEIGAEVLH
jgi:hypothetical protein